MMFMMDLLKVSDCLLFTFPILFTSDICLWAVTALPLVMSQVALIILSDNTSSKMVVRPSYSCFHLTTECCLRAKLKLS